MTGLLVACCGALFAVGIVFVIAGLVRREPISTASSTGMWTKVVNWRIRLGRRGLIQLGVGAASGLALYAVIGWPLLLILPTLALLGLPALLSSPPARELELLQALDRWIRTLTATLPTGKSISDAIRVSARQAPDMLADGLRLLQLRVDDRWSTEDALRAFADELNTPDADSIVAALILAAHRGGTGATATLTALSEAVQDRLRAMREIEAERAKPRIVVRQVTIITVVVLAGALLFGGTFFEPYSTPLGQLILTGLVAAYIGSLVLLRRMTIPRRRERVLVRA